MRATEGGSSAVPNGKLKNSRALVRDLYEAFNARQPEQLDRLLAPHFIDHTAGPGQRPGIEGIKEVWTQMWTRMPDLHIVAEDVLAEGDRVAVRVSFHYSSPEGEPKTGIGFEIFRIVHGQVTELSNLLHLR